MKKIFRLIAFLMLVAGTLSAQDTSKSIWRVITEYRKSNASSYFSGDAGYYIAEGKKKGLNNDYNGAIADFNFALLDDSIRPKQALDAYYNRGLAYYYQKDYKNSIADLSKAIAIDSTIDNYYNQRGICYTTLGDYVKAKKDFEKSLYLNPNSADGNLDMGVMYLTTGNYDLACEYLAKAKKAGSKNAEDAMNVYCKGK